MYKVTVTDFNGYRKMIIQNVNKAYYFYIFSANFHPLWDQTNDAIIACYEESSEKFYTLEDCEEDVGRLIERMCGYKNGEIPMDQIFNYNTFQIHQEDVDDCRKEVKI